MNIPNILHLLRMRMRHLMAQVCDDGSALTAVALMLEKILALAEGGPAFAGESLRRFC